MYQKIPPLFAIGLAVLSVTGCGREDSSSPADIVADPQCTAEYIASIDLRKLELLGSDFTNPRYDHARLGIPQDEFRPTLDYDWKQLDEVQQKLKGVDRRRVLQHIWSEVTKDSDTNTEKHLALLKFLHRAGFHNTHLRAQYRDHTKVFDPLVLIELGEMHCTQVARVACDLWEAAGYEARCINFGAKLSAEVYYDEAWHYFGADSVAGNGIALFKPDGTIPSWVELSREPSWIDLLPYRYELNNRGQPRTGGTPARSVNCFYNTKGRPPQYMVKRKTANLSDRYYGWNDVVILKPDWNLYEGTWHYQPGVARFQSIQLQRDDGSEKQTAEVTWRPSRDRDNDLLGYRIYISQESRGWNYSTFPGSDEAAVYWSNPEGWKPEMYDSLYRMPPSEIGVFETAEPTIRLELDPTTDHFITIMPFDAYHESIGKKMYLMSNELRIPADPEL